MNNFMNDDVKTFGARSNIRHEYPPMRDLLKTKKQRENDETLNMYYTSASNYGTKIYKN